RLFACHADASLLQSVSGNERPSAARVARPFRSPLPLTTGLRRPAIKRSLCVFLGGLQGDLSWTLTTSLALPTTKPRIRWKQRRRSSPASRSSASSRSPASPHSNSSSAAPNPPPSPTPNPHQ